MRFSWLPSVSICAALDAQIRQLEARVHVCGHTHTTVDSVIDDVRYIQNAVRYPKERRRESIPIKQIWTTTTPKAFANSSPGFERSENPGSANKN
jgi:hypothetical protein